MNYENLINNLIERDDPFALSDAFDACRELETVDVIKIDGTGRRDYGTTIYDKDNFKSAHNLNKRVRQSANRMIKDGVAVDRMIELYYRTHLFDAPHFLQLTRTPSGRNSIS